MLLFHLVHMSLEIATDCTAQRIRIGRITGGADVLSQISVTPGHALC